MSTLKAAIERLAGQPDAASEPEARTLFQDFRDQLTQGKIRAA